ncbi:MAG: hypothetical protein JXB60_04790 [Candidatus Cloacimonetes bacterium]|nr:hypothetical protein [Candidatus Cloacimonadota bacterium]
MYYGDIVQSLMQDKKNPVNSMYLHEINIKWRNFEKIAAESEVIPNTALIEALNNFIVAIANQKFIYNPVTKNGFKSSSPIYSALYLDDLISLLMNKIKIIDNKGITWGYQKFSTNLKFNPQNLCLMEENPMFEQTYSEEILCLSQKMDFQFRVLGKRNFHRYQITFPLILFHTMQNMTENDFIRIEYLTKLAKSTFEKSRTIVVTETIEDGFMPMLLNSFIDIIFVLRKSFGNGKELPLISYQVVEKLDQKILEFLTQKERINNQFLETGVLE